MDALQFLLLVVMPVCVALGAAASADGFGDDRWLNEDFGLRERAESTPQPPDGAAVER